MGWDTIPILSPCSNKREMVEGNFVGGNFLVKGENLGGRRLTHNSGMYGTVRER
jgi:hypothetical protein